MTTKIAGGEELQRIVANEEEIAEYIESHSKPREKWLFGIEYERLGVRRDDCSAIPYDGGVEKVLDTMAAEFGWERGLENGRIIYLHRGVEQITLEPGGQTEYSSAPARTIAELMTSARTAVRELDAAAARHGFVYLGIGYHPYSKLDEIGFVPKSRYKVMAPYLSKRGTLALEMMKMTAGCQVALDYCDAADAMRKLRAAALATPIAQALFAASSVGGGSVLDVVDHRARIWTATDDSRCNIPDFMLKKSSDLMEYVDWLLDMPLMFVEQDGVYCDGAGMTLRSMMRRGGIRYYDVESAMTQAFPEVRIKRFIEIRSLDAPQPYLLATVPCFWSSLIYGDLDQVFDLLGGLSGEQFDELRRQAIDRGLRGFAAGRRISEWAKDLLSIAADTCTCEHSLGLLRERAESGAAPADFAAELVAGGIAPAEFAQQWNVHRSDGGAPSCG